MSHILEGKTVLSKHVKAGFWTTDQITISDQVGNERHSGVDDFGWKLYLDNPLEDVVAPKYMVDSISTSLVNDTIDGKPVQILQVSWDVEENVRMASWANCYVSIRPPGEDAYRLENMDMVSMTATTVIILKQKDVGWILQLPTLLELEYMRSEKSFWPTKQ